VNLQDIIKAEALTGRAIRSIRPWVDDGSDRAALERGELILAEARQFAVNWDHIRSWEDAKTIDADKAKTMRKEAIQRLTTFCAPSRL